MRKRFLRVALNGAWYEPKDLSCSASATMTFSRRSLSLRSAFGKLVNFGSRADSRTRAMVCTSLAHRFESLESRI